MKIGLTYDLRRYYELDPDLPTDFYGEFDSEETIAALRMSLGELGHQVVEVGNIERLIHFLSKGETVELMFNIAEGIWGRSREAQIPAILEAFRIPYTFSDPLTLGVCLDKVIAKKLLQQSGILTPSYCVVTDYDQPLELLEALDWPLFVKPSLEGTSKGINEQSVVRSQDELVKQTRWVLQEYKQPVLVEEYLPGPEFTVGVLGTGDQVRVVGALEITMTDESDIYGFLQKEECETRVLYTPVTARRTMDELARLAVDAYCVMGCRDAGRVDIRLDSNGRYQVLEVNPLAGMHPTHSDLPIIANCAGMTYKELVAEILAYATQRA